MILLTTPSAVPILSDEIYQDWPAINQTNFVVNVATGLVPSKTIIFSIKDVIDNPIYAVYSNFRLRSYQQYAAPTLEWIDESSITSNGYASNEATTTPITTNGLSFTFIPSFQNINLLNNGFSYFKSYFKIEALNASGIWVEITSYTHTVRIFKLMTISPTAVTFTPSYMFFNAILGATTPHQEINLTGNWEFTVPLHFNLSTSDSGVTFESFAFGTKASANGNKTIKIAIDDSYFETLSSPEGALQFTSAIIDNTATTIIGELQLLVAISNGTGTVFPQEFNFNAIKYIQEPEIQFGFISGIIDFDIVSPPWLIIETGEFLIEGILIGNISIKPIATASMEPGFYQTIVLLKYSLEGEEYSLEIPVNYTLSGLVSSPYTNTAFTLDNVFFDFASEYPETYFEVTSTIKTAQRFSQIQTEIITLDKLPLFNGKAKLHLGKRIHQIMPKLEAINSSEFQYIPAELSMEISEKNLSDNEIIRSITTEVVKFVPGLSFTLSNTLNTFLDCNPNPQRVLQNSFHYLNMLLQQGLYKIEVYKNNILQESLPLTANFTGVYTKKIGFENSIEGDVIKVILKSGYSDVELDQKIFLGFPTQDHSNFIYWQNEYLTQSVIEFTGSYKLASDLEYISQSLWISLSDVLENSSNKTTSKFSINTGWLTKKEHFTIMSILQSKKVWFQNNEELIYITPITKSVPNIDSERYLNGFDLEFQINRKYNEKNYMF